MVAAVLFAASLSGENAAAQTPPTGTLIVIVRGDDGPVARAAVQAGSARGVTDEAGTVTLRLPEGRIDVVVTRAGFDPAASPVDVRAGSDTRIEIAMAPQSEIGETVIVSATRAERRIEDEPLRVEVVPEEEVQEKIVMTPGDVSMLLAETNGLRVQSTSPSLGGATVRIQGLSGRYTQVLADGLPLYGGQSGSTGILQIPPMDLAQVEVIKGVASALYGMSAIGGVVNLVSRRPRVGAPEREILINRTSHRGTDAALWLAQPLNTRWGVSLLGGTYFQNRSDLDGDGWTDLPMYRRTQVRPRIFWDNGEGRSVLVALGAMAEERRGGTMPGALAPDGRPHPENLDTGRFDGGVVGRFLMPGARVLAVRASAMTQHHDRTFGDVAEDSRSTTAFGEASLKGTNGRQTWVGGLAIQRDSFRSSDVPRFDYTYTVPGVFVQDDFAVTPRLTLSGSGRLDIHNTFGTFFSPKVSAFVRAGGGVSVRVSGGRGHYAPVPFTEETEAAGLTPLAPLGDLRPEDAGSVSADVTWNRAPLEVTATLFSSRIEHALMYRVEESGPYPARIINAAEPTRTRGTEFIARFHKEQVDLILTHMYVWSAEADEEGSGTHEVPLNPRHSASADLLWAFGRSRLGVEAFYTGRQALEDNPYRSVGGGYILFGALFTYQLGPALLYINSENLGDVRQTKDDPLIRPAALRDGRWSTDAWAPLDGRALNAGLRFRF